MQSPLQIWAPHPRMVSGHNLQHMAPFEALTNGFCMVFRPATLIFLTPGPIFGALGQGLGPRRPGGPFWAQNGGPKNATLWRDWSPMTFPRICCEGNGLYGTQEPFGCTNFPPIPPRGRFYWIFPKSENPQGTPGPLGGLPIVPLWAAIALGRPMALFGVPLLSYYISLVQPSPVSIRWCSSTFSLLQLL